MQRITQLQLNHWIKESEIIQRYAAYDGINTVGLLKTSDEVKQEQKAAAEAQSRQMGEEELAKSAGKGAGETLTKPQQ